MFSEVNFMDELAHQVSRKSKQIDAYLKFEAFLCLACTFLFVSVFSSVDDYH